MELKNVKYCHLYSDEPNKVPKSLMAGEIAINRADKKIYISDSNNDVVAFSGDIDNSELIAAAAYNLEGLIDKANDYAYCPVGNDSDVKNGTAELLNIKGNAIAWNQLVEPTHYVTANHTGGITIEKTDYSIHITSPNITGVYGGIALQKFIIAPYLIAGHRYLLRFNRNITKGTLGDVQIRFYAYSLEEDSKLINAISNTSMFSLEKDSKICAGYATLENAVGKEFDGTWDDINIFDLTLIYGAGNEPTTTEQFEEDYQRWFGKTLSYEEHDDGSIRSVLATGIKTVGFNLSNITEFEGTGSVWYNNRKRILWKNDCGYKGQLYVNANASSSNPDKSIIIGVAYTDGAYGWLWNSKNNPNGVLSNKNKQVAYLYADMSGGTGSDTIIVRNLCINFSWSGKRDGEYEPHWEETKSLPITTLTSGGVPVFPDGLKRAGDVCDEIVVENGITKAIKRVGSIDLGTLSWTFYPSSQQPAWPDAFCTKRDAIDANASNIATTLNGKYTIRTSYNNMPDKSLSRTGLVGTNNIIIKDSSFGTDTVAFKQSLAGQILYYELATPEEYILDDFTLPLAYRIDDFGTEQIIAPENSIAPTLTTRYGINAVDTIRRLPDVYLNKKEAKQTYQPLGEYAEANGVYPDMTVGTAVNLEGNVEVVSDSKYHTSANDIDIKYDTAEILNVKGNAIAWNQLLSFGEIDSSFFESRYGISVKSTGNNTIKFYGDLTSSIGGIRIVDSTTSVIVGHKYLCRINSIKKNSDNVNCLYFYFKDKATSKETTQKAAKSHIFTIAEEGEIGLLISISSTLVGTPIDVTYEGINFFDLTLIYGAGNEPTSVEQFESDYQKWFGKTLSYEDYDNGSIKPVLATGIKTVGFNLYDGGDFNGDAREWYNAVENHIQWKNDCGYKGQIQITCDYDETPLEAGKPVSGKFQFYYTDGTMSVPTFAKGRSSVISDANKIVERIQRYISNYGSLSIKNLCINFSWSGKRDGEYEPYWSETKELPITTLKGRLNGEGESVLIFPDGLKKAGNIYDEIKVENGVAKAIKRVGSVDLGTLDYGYTSSIKRFATTNTITSIKPTNNWNEGNALCAYYKYGAISSSGDNEDKLIGILSQKIYLTNNSYTDADSLKQSLQGTILYYELAEPEEYVLDNFGLPTAYRIDDFGTEEIIGDGITPIITTKCGINAVDSIRRLPDVYLSKREAENTYVKKGDTTKKAYEFTIPSSAIEQASLNNSAMVTPTFNGVYDDVYNTLMSTVGNIDINVIINFDNGNSVTAFPLFRELYQPDRYYSRPYFQYVYKYNDMKISLSLTSTSFSAVVSDENAIIMSHIKYLEERLDRLDPTLVD